MNEKRRFLELDALRFVAALMVVFYHFGTRPFYDSVSLIRFAEIPDYLKYNYLAVNLFFMISGFVILLTAQARSVSKFAISRAVRLYPAFWICCSLSFSVILLLMHGKIQTSWPRYFMNLTMLNGFVGVGGIDGTYWTLLIEFKFYLLVLGLLWAGCLGRVSYFLGVWFLISIINFLHPSSIVEYIFIPEYAGYFIAGCCFFLIRQHGWSIYLFVMLVGSFIVGVMYDSLILIDKSVWYHLEFSLGVLVAILGAFYALFVILISIKENWISPSWAKVLVLGGAISYPFYLLHDAIGLSMMNAFAPYLPALWVYVATVLGMILLAWFVHRWGERPLAIWLLAQLISFEQRYERALRKFLRKGAVADVAGPITK